MEEVAAAVNSVIECINENIHRANLIVETTPGFFPKAQQLQTEWKQTAEERAEVIKQVNKLNWETY